MKILNSVQQQKGMTLIELMIGLVIAMILLAGVAEIFLGSKQTYRYQAGMARMQENGRYTLSTVTEKIRMAGYMGCYSMDTSETVNTVNGGGAVEFDFSKPIVVWEATTTGYETNKDATLWTAEVPDDVRLLINSTPSGTDFSDILIFTGAGNDGIRLASAMPNSSAVVKLVNHSPEVIFTDDILLVSDCQKSAIFQATNVTYPNSTSPDVNVAHNAGGGGTPGNSTKDLTGDGSSFNSDASLFSIQKIHYFVAPSSVNNNSNDTVMALWRKVNANDPEELVAGIENFQLTLGEDVDDDKSADRYGTANIVDFENVVSVRVELDANTVERINTKSDIDDAIPNQSFVQTVLVRNRSI